MNLDEIMDAARQRIRAPDGDEPLFCRHLQFAVMALREAIRDEDWQRVADALAHLEECGRSRTMAEIEGKIARMQE